MSDHVSLLCNMREIQDVSVLLQQRRGNRKRTWLPSHESPTRTRTNLARIWTSSTWYSLAKQGSKASKIGQESFEDVLREMQSSLDWRNRRSLHVRKRNERAPVAKWPQGINIAPIELNGQLCNARSSLNRHTDLFCSCSNLDFN